MGRNDEPNDLFPVCVACLQTFPKILTVQQTLIIFRGVHFLLCRCFDFIAKTDYYCVLEVGYRVGWIWRFF